MSTLKDRVKFSSSSAVWWRRSALGLAIAGAVAFHPVIALAHQSPGSCNSNRLNASIIKDRTEVYQGQTLTYTVTVNNVNFSGDIACDITNATVSITLPAPDGTPTGSVVTIATNADYPAGTTTTIVGTAQYVVAVNPGVTDIVAKADVTGTLHDAPVDHSAQIIKTIGTSVVEPPASAGSGGSGAGAVASSGSGGTAAAIGSSGTRTTSSALPGLPNTGTAKR